MTALIIITGTAFTLSLATILVVEWKRIRREERDLDQFDIAKPREGEPATQAAA